MQNRCKKKACKKCGKWWQKGAKMGAEIHQKSEKWWKKRMPKNNVEIWGQKNQSLRDFAGGLGSIFGGAGEGGKLKPANTSWLIIIWHARHPGGVRRKSIADAERHRRTPWTPADESKSIRGKKSADIGDTGEKKKPKNMAQSRNNMT